VTPALRCAIHPPLRIESGGATWVPTDDFAQLQLQLVDQTQWRYEVIRPLVLFADRTPRQRADETDTHASTVRTLTRRFRQQGMVGLLPEDVEVSVRARMPRVPEAVREEVDRLKALYEALSTCCLLT
jgi:hypothetical protein